MEGGLQIDIGLHHALRMRSGTIHEVRTPVGGFIVTKGYIDESTVDPMSRWLARSDNHINRLDEEGKDLALGNWIDAAELACLEDLARSWRIAAEMLLSISSSSSARQKRLCNFLKDVRRDSRCEWIEDALQRMAKIDKFM